MTTASTVKGTRESSAAQRRLQAVKRLPAPQPGLVVKVPLALWPLYMELHQIEPKQYEISTRILIVKRRAER